MSSRRPAPASWWPRIRNRWTKVLDIQGSLPRFERVVYHDAKGLSGYDREHLVFFPDVEEMGKALSRENPTAFDEMVGALDPESVALLCTTSGTTSRPKLAMLSHTNLISMAEQMQRVDPMVAEDDVVSFLPLAWIGEQMVTLSWALTVGFTTNFPEESGHGAPGSPGDRAQGPGLAASHLGEPGVRSAGQDGGLHRIEAPRVRLVHGGGQGHGGRPLRRPQAELRRWRGSTGWPRRSPCCP